MEEDPFTRIKQVVRWYVAGFYKKPKVGHGEQFWLLAVCRSLLLLIYATAVVYPIIINGSKTTVIVFLMIVLLVEF